MKYVINLDPAEEVLDGQQLDALIKLWLSNRQASPEVSEHTARGYANCVAYFRQWWRDVGPWVNWELTRDKFSQYGEWLATVPTQFGKPMTYNSQKYALRRLKQCLAWAASKDYIARDISSWVPTAAGAAPLRERASLDDLAALMEAAGRSGCPVRDQAYVALLIGTGLRKMEAANLDVGDIRMNADLSGTAAVRRAKRVKGRSVQGRVVAFDRWTGHYLAALLDELGEGSGPLFRCDDGVRRLSAMAAYRAVKKAIRRAGLEERLQGPHDLRRNFATWFSQQHRGEVYGSLLSKQLGHSQFQMTDRYILQSADDLAEVIESPLANHMPPAPITEAKKRVPIQGGMLPTPRRRRFPDLD